MDKKEVVIGLLQKENNLCELCSIRFGEKLVFLNKKINYKRNNLQLVCEDCFDKMFPDRKKPKQSGYVAGEKNFKPIKKRLIPETDNSVVRDLFASEDWPIVDGLEPVVKDRRLTGFRSHIDD